MKKRQKKKKYADSEISAESRIEPRSNSIRAFSFAQMASAKNINPPLLPTPRVELAPGQENRPL